MTVLTRGPATQRGGTRRGPAVNRVGASRVSMAQAVPLPAPLADAVVLLRASRLSAGTYTPGDPWPNEGTGGAAYDGVMVGTPALATSPEKGLVFGGSEGVGPYGTVPGEPLIDADDESFTVAVRFLWTHETSAFDPVAAKITGSLGVDGQGWFLGSATSASGSIASITDGGTSPGTDPALAIDPGGVLAQGEHLLVLRVDRADDELSLAVDGEIVATVDCSGVASASSAPTDHDIILGREYAQTHYDVAYWARALTDTEITVDLPAALGS